MEPDPTRPPEMGILDAVADVVVQWQTVLL